MASKIKAASNTHTIVLRVSVKSEHPNIDTVMLLREIDAAQPELRTRLREVASVNDVSIERRGTLPIGLEAAVIAVLVEVGKELGKDLTKELARKAFEWMKGRWNNAEFRKLSVTKPRKRSAVTVGKKK